MWDIFKEAGERIVVIIDGRMRIFRYFTTQGDVAIYRDMDNDDGFVGRRLKMSIPENTVFPMRRVTKCTTTYEEIIGRS